MTSQSPLRVGFIGLGHIATRAHLPALKPLIDAGRVVLQAFCDVDPHAVAERAREHGVTGVYTDHREMLDKERLDALFLVIPPTLHTDAELLAADKRIPILVEKPQSLDVAQAARFDAALRASGTLSTVGFMMRYYPAAAHLRERVAQLTPRHANLQIFYSGAPIRHWTNRMELCGGSFVENSIHLVDLLRYLLDDDYERVSAFYHERAATNDPVAVNLPYAYNVNYRLRRGTVANVTTSRVLTRPGCPRRRDLVIVCDDALLEYSHDCVRENGEVIWQQEQAADPFALQAEAFITAVERGDPSSLRCSYATALNSLAAVLAANASAGRGGEVIHLDEFTRPA